MKYTKQQQEEVKHFLEFLDIRTGIKNLEFSNADVITDMQEEIERLNNIINEFDKWLLGEQMMFYRGSDNERLIRFGETKNKWLELKESNEPSFEEMVNFAENVCKDIKNQPTLDEELEEERERIAKIVDDFKGVDKE